MRLLKEGECDIINGIKVISSMGWLMTINIHLRNVDEKLILTLKKQAATEDVSVNTLILILLRRSLGLTSQQKTHVYHDLDNLCGTWTKQEGKAFLSNTSEFEKIDKDIWK